MNLLLINLTRFGDLLQMQPLLHGLAAEGHRIGLVCLDNFAGATALLRHVDHVFPLPGGRLLAALESDWRHAAAHVRLLRQEIETTFPVDGVLNLTATLSARLLARHCTPAGVPLLGFAMDAHGFGINADPWTTFLQASTRQRGCSPFNLVDLFRHAAGVGHHPPRNELCPPTQHMLAETRARLEALAPAGAAGYVALQLGASENRRRWPVASFATVARTLWEAHRLCPVLLGTRAERHLADRFAASVGAPCIDLVGETSLEQLSATLLHTRLLVTNDTGTMHLAAGLGVPCLAIFLATAQPWDTGPYLPDCCCLEPALDCHPCPFASPCPHNERCRTTITPETVNALLAARLAGDTWEAPHHASAQTRIWRTHFNAEGFHDLHSLSGHERDDRTVWIRLQRHYYRQFLDREMTSSPADGTPQPYQHPQLVHLPSASLQAAITTTLAQAEALFHLLEQQGTLLSMQPNDMTKQRFLGTCGKVRALFDSAPRFNVLEHLWLTESQQAGDNLSNVLALAARYRQLAKEWRTALQPHSE